MRHGYSGGRPDGVCGGAIHQGRCVPHLLEGCPFMLDMEGNHRFLKQNKNTV